MDKDKKIEVELDEKTAQGVYSNFAVINHSGSEFVIDFMTILPGLPKAKVRSRIVLTPQHAKSFLGALSENVHKFENINGEIEDDKSPGIPISFGTPGQA